MAMPALEIHTSEPIHYRMRAEFTIWHEGEDLYFVMFDTTKGECACQCCCSACLSVESRPFRERKRVYLFIFPAMNPLFDYIPPFSRRNWFCAAFSGTFGRPTVKIGRHETFPNTKTNALVHAQAAFSGLMFRQVSKKVYVVSRCRRMSAKLCQSLTSLNGFSHRSLTHSQDVHGFCVQASDQTRFVFVSRRV